jgi:RNA polymerase sigma factor (sigma-70 family)
LFKKPSDSKIIEGLRVQDEKILNFLYDNYYYTVKDHVLKNSGSVEDASDVLQESIIILYKQVSSPDFKLTSDMKGYFFGIARNIWNAQLRQRKPNSVSDLDLIVDADTDDLEEQMFERAVSNAFIKLKPDCQTMLKLYAEGLSYAEIAVRMGLRNETYARRKKYLCKETLIEIIKEDPENKDIQRFLK